MTQSENQVTLKGYVGNDPEYRVNNLDQTVAMFVIGTNDMLFGEVKKQWHNIVVVDQSLIAQVKSDVKKGSHVEVVGTLYYHKSHTSKYFEKARIEIVLTENGSITLQPIDTKLQATMYND